MFSIYCIVHTEKTTFPIPFQLKMEIELNQMEFHLVQNRKKICHHDHIPFNVKGNMNLLFSVQNRSENIFLSPNLIRYQTEETLPIRHTAVERLTSLGIMRASLKPLEHHSTAYINAVRC